MLTVKPQLKLRSAREYFREHLCVGEYYSQEQRMTGEWFGQGAEKLGLKATVGEAEFLRLCEGEHPVTGKRLTLRQNSTRQSEDGRNVANRRVFYDSVVGAPKSVSVVALMQDDRILALHQRSVRLALVELEKFAATRIRKSGQSADRPTGNLVTACFRHDATRELDPHLHTHCVVFNATFDPAEDRWKALQVEAMYRAQRFVENCYFHELAKGLRGLGYETENEGRAFRIKGVPASVTTRFSKRHEQINLETKQRLEREGWQGNIKELRKRVAHDGRRRKTSDATAENLRPGWKQQLAADEIKAMEALRPVPSLPSDKADPAKILAWTDEHLFERRSVVNDYELMATALEHGRGGDFDLTALRAEIEKRGYIREEGTRKLTSPGVLRCELGIVVAAHDGRDQHLPLNSAYPLAPMLAAEQAAAVQHILSSRDFITLFRGSAGTGKSFTLREVTQGLHAARHPVVVLAPQRQQVADLCADGLKAITLSHCLQSKTLPDRAVVLVDEAGQVGGRQLGDLVALVQKHDGRLILSGDTRQHGAVQALDAFRAIEEFAGLKAAVLREIRRQDPARTKTLEERAFVTAYRDAVKSAAAGRISHSFDALDRMGCIREVAPENRRDQLAREYLTSLERQERALVVSQTWTEVNAVNEAIRSELQKAGRIGSGSVLKAYQTVDFGIAQKRDARFYQPGQYAYLIQRYGRFAKGELIPIVGTNHRGVILLKNGRRSTMSYRQNHRIAVVAEREMRVATGDRLQLKFNGEARDGQAISNGELVTVRRVHRDGALTVEDDRRVVKTLSPRQRLFNRGYAVTSYASQGKTVDTVLIADSACRAATNSNQWYVAISRARKRIAIFTDNKAELRRSIEQSGDRQLALELKFSPSTPPIQHGLLPRMRAWLPQKLPTTRKPHDQSRY